MTLTLYTLTKLVNNANLFFYYNWNNFTWNQYQTIVCCCYSTSLFLCIYFTWNQFQLYIYSFWALSACEILNFLRKIICFCYSRALLLLCIFFIYVKSISDLERNKYWNFSWTEITYLLQQLCYLFDWHQFYVKFVKIMVSVKY